MALNKEIIKIKNGKTIKINTPMVIENAFFLFVKNTGIISLFNEFHRV